MASSCEPIAWLAAGFEGRRRCRRPPRRGVRAGSRRMKIFIRCCSNRIGSVRSARNVTESRFLWRREVNTDPLQQDDKSRPGEQVETILSEEPPVLTKHGKARVALLPGPQWDALQMANERSLKAVLLSATGRAAIAVPARSRLKLRRA